MELNLELEHIDIKIVILYGDLEETMYMKQPEGFTVGDRKDYVCKLKRSLYVQNNPQGIGTSVLMSSWQELALNVASMIPISSSCF